MSSHLFGDVLVNKAYAERGDLLPDRLRPSDEIKEWLTCDFGGPKSSAVKISAER